MAMKSDGDASLSGEAIKQRSAKNALRKNVANEKPRGRAA